MADKIYRVPTIYNEMKKTNCSSDSPGAGFEEYHEPQSPAGYAGRWRIDLARSIVLR